MQREDSCCSSDALAIADCVSAGKSPKLIARLRISSRLKQDGAASWHGTLRQPVGAAAGVT